MRDHLDLPTLLDGIVDDAVSLFGADRAGLWRVDEDSRHFTLSAQRGLGDESGASTRLELDGRTPLGRSVRSGQVRIVRLAGRNGAMPAVRGFAPGGANGTAFVIPIAFRDEPLAVMILHRPDRRRWRAEDREAARGFASQAAAALNNARLYASVRGLEARLRSIQDLTERLSRIRDVKGIGEAIVDEVSALIRYDTVRVYLVDAAAGMCEPIAFKGRFLGLPNPSLDLLRVPVGKGLTGWVAANAQPILTGDAALDGRSLTIGDEEGPESLLLVPMSYEDRVLGIIVLSKNGRDQFSAEDLTTITIFGGHAAQAIANAESFERVRRQQAELEYQLASQRKLLEVNEQLLSTLDPQGVLETIADSLKSVVAYDTLAIYRADRASATRRALLARDRFADVILDQVSPIYKGLTGWVIEHGEPVFANDAHLDPRTSQIPGTPFEPESMLIVPLQVSGDVVGTLNVGRIGAEEAHFTPNEFELTKLFAGQASIALQNAEAHQAVEVRADRDSLTGLRNHGAFQRELDHLIARGQGSPFALLMMDLDNFKAYNDTLGHPAGDRLLREVAGRLITVTREVDHVYRYGGDEFAILLPAAGRSQAYEIAERVRHAVAGLTSRERNVHVAISVGIACFPDEGRTRDDLVAGADAMLYMSKPARVGQIPGIPGAAHDAYVASLHETVLGLLDRLDPSDLLEMIVSRAAGLLGTEHGYLNLVDPDGSAMTCRVGIGMFAGHVGRRVSMGEGLTGRVWQTSQSITIDDYATWDNRLPDLGLHGSLVGVPLIARSHVIGVLGLASGTADRSFSEREIVILHRFADLTSVALDNAELLAAAKRAGDERRDAEERLSSRSLYDSLTGLPNRELLMDRLLHALARGERSGTASALLLLDLDRFGLVNDSFGYAAGDQLLASVARRLQASVRPGDTVARFGGDEFVVLLEAVASIEEAVRVADRIGEGLTEPFPLGERDGFVTASIGIALAQPGRVGAGEVLRNADIAMHRAKADAAMRHAVFEPAMSAPAMERLALENNLRRAIDRRELRLWFQPLLELGSGRLVGHEALLRWHHPDRGLLLPASFIPLAEETGLILPLGAWVLDAACRQARAWRDEMKDVPGAWPLAMSVNLSAREFGQPDLVSKVADALESNGLEPSLLELEITESVVMSDAEAVIMRLHQLRGLGVHLVLDDFGTGYSSLSYLRRLPLDVIKVDRSFVAAVTSDPATRSIVNAVVNLAHGLGMSVTAEGIETEAQLVAMRELGCDLAQGNYYAPAMPTDRLALAGLTRPRVVGPGVVGG